MNKINMQAKLLILLVEIEEIFFNEQQVKVHPMLLTDKLTMNDISFSSSFAILNEEQKRIQVSVRFQTRTERKQPIDFSLSCVGLYKLENGDLDETTLKNIYNWGVAIQTGAVRQKLSEILQTSPYHEVWYLPISLVKIETVEQ